MVLNWLENLTKEERPPEYLWEDDKGLELWWATVEAKREDGTSISRGPTDDDDDDGQTPRQMENDHARYLKEAMA
jgi:hypothetical protein